MMLIGYADGVEVKFNFCPPSTFRAEIPKNKNGIYIIELHAIDDAGNQTNMSSIAILIDFDRLTFKVLDKEFTEKAENKNYIHKELQQNYGYKELM